MKHKPEKTGQRAMDPRGRRPGAPYSRFLLALGALLVALVLAEAWCRRNFNKTVEAMAFAESDLYYYYDPAGHRHHIPHKTGYERMWNDQGKAEFRINGWGFRGPEIPHEKTADTFRILFLGDSITLGGRLPEEAPFVSQVGKRLPTTGAPRYEVVNAGVGDVGLIEEQKTLETAGLAVRPDLVVLCWYLNDARPPVGFPEEVIYKNPAIRWFNRQHWLKGSYLAGFLYDRLRRSLVSRQMHLMDAENRRFEWAQSYMEGGWRKDPDAFLRLVRAARFDWGDAWNESSIRWTQDRILRMKEFLSKNSVRFAVVMLPAQAQVYAGFDSPLLQKPQRDLGTLLQAAGIPYLDLIPALKAKAGEPIFYDQCHYTPRGNEVVAESILDFLRTTGMLKRT